MAKPHDRALVCPQCGYRVNFILNVATITSQNWVQTHAMRFKLDTRSPKEFDFTVTLFLACGQCGQSIAPPSDLLKRADPRR